VGDGAREGQDGVVTRPPPSAGALQLVWASYPSCTEKVQLYQVSYEKKNPRMTNMLKLFLIAMTRNEEAESLSAF